MSTDTVDSVKVRMYRHGFGDCFLISFFHKSKRVRSMLVDCGIKHNTSSDDVPIKDVIDDLKKVLTPTGGDKPVIDVLVATHEHWDHVAFFHPTAKLFNEFEIGETWLAWTEDPDDQEAKTINSRLREGAAALHVAALHLKSAEAEENARFTGFRLGADIAAARDIFNVTLDGVLGFYGATVQSKSETSPSGIKYKENGKISVDTEDAMSHIVALGKKGGIRYLKPGTKVDKRVLPSGVNVYVLGPPRSGIINKSKPSSGAAKETYLGIDDSGLSGFIDGLLEMAASANTKSPTMGTETEGPFGRDAGIPREKALNDPYFKKTYFATEEKYRQIDYAWLDVAGQFALQLDGAINNTSLVLAIELEGSGKVLLFPGDAQVGSWLSWHDHKWKVKRGDKTETITAKELLKNTVLYKVSHHGSHNATLEANGLELMTHPDLVAMIPEKEKSYNGILYQPLLDRLKQACKGRVLVSKDVNYPPEDFVKNCPAELSAAEWASFKGNLKVKPLYVEYTVR
jgi:hypothetical protein